MQAVRLDQITLDADLQPCAAIDQDAVLEYAEALKGGAQFPRIRVFLDGATYWLADGYHRWHAHKRAGVEDIAANVQQGNKQDAIRYSLSANHDHGRQRGPADYKKAFEIACRNDLVTATDVEAVQDLLKCSIRWARDLTKDARTEADRIRDEAIRKQKAKGASDREAAKAVGVSRTTVERASGSKRKTAEKSQAPQPHSAAPAATVPTSGRPASRDPDMTTTAAAFSIAQPDPPRPMFNPEAFLRAAKDFHDPALKVWAGFIIDAEAFVEGVNAAELRSQPYADLRPEALQAARAVVGLVNTILADLEAINVHAA